MRRFSFSTVSTLVLIATVLFAALAATGPSQEAGETAAAAARSPRGTDLSLPGFRELRTENVQQELELTPQQKEKLAAIGQKYYEQARRDWAGYRGMSPEERKKKYADIRQENLGRMKEVRQQVENLLSPDQLERFKQINLRTRGAAALANTKILDQLDITEPQRKRLRQIRQQLQEKMRKLQQESLEQTLQVLTPQQRKRLEQITTEGFGTYGVTQTTARQ